MGQVHAMSNRPIKSFHNQQISCSISSSHLLSTNYSRLHNKHIGINGSIRVVEPRQRLCHLHKLCWCLWYCFQKRMWNQLRLVRIPEEDANEDPAMLMSRQPHRSQSTRPLSAQLCNYRTFVGYWRQEFSIVCVHSWSDT